MSLDKGAHRRIEPFLANFRVDLGTKLAPMIQRPFKVEGLRALDRAIEGNPRHHLRMGKVLRSSADLPDTLVWQAPYLFKVRKQNALKTPGFGKSLQPADARLVQRVQDLAKDVDL